MAKTWMAVVLAALAVTARSMSVDTHRRPATAGQACQACGHAFLVGLCYVAPCSDGSGEYCWTTTAADGYASCSKDHS